MNFDQPVAVLKQAIDSREAAIRAACELEATAKKLGNVHPGASFTDCSYDDFIAAATVISPILARQSDDGRIGTRILDAVIATKAVCSANVNLGIILLIAPLAMIDDRDDMKSLLNRLDERDGKDVFEAIRTASPGGMKQSNVPTEHDVRRIAQRPIDLIEAMRSAADRDRIALQFATDFDDFYDTILPIVEQEIAHPIPATDATVNAQLRLMAVIPDTLIARKCGTEIANEAMQRARHCLATNTSQSRREFDAWLRADGNQRNPGTTADLLAASLYWILRPR